ncbi:hypothetical protein F5X96DRAFT_618478 [Biscogniauxia mediterranea]|nr:hypothetical protein F5X96DRAFT_618478 [Biscogniauxia mediterranea]
MADTPTSHTNTTPTPTATMGGFIPPRNPFSSLPSPSPSTASSRIAAGLPHPRSKPLVPGSRKEDYAREYVSQRLLHVSRRFVKKHGLPDPADQVTGYETMDEVCRDLEEVVDVLWFSGTPSIQIPYLLNVALAFNTYLPSFPPSPRPTFALLKKLDHCFASLLVGYDIRTKDPLPGFQRGLSAGLSRTEMVRCKSLADETRMLVAMVMSGEADVDNYDSDPDEDSRSAKPPATKTKEKEAPPGFVETVGVEEIEDFDDYSNSDFDNEDENMVVKPERAESPPKRKVCDTADLMEEDTTHKRVKIEEEDSEMGLYPEPGDTRQDEATKNTSSTPAANGGGDSTGQFHWALDDDDDDGDDDDDESENETLPNTINKETKVVVEEVQTTAPPPHVVVQPSEIDNSGEGDSNMGRMNMNVNDEEDEGSGSDSDEELHLNVGKVYSKTLVQLGKSLGESLIDDDI